MQKYVPFYQNNGAGRGKQTQVLHIYKKNQIQTMPFNSSPFANSIYILFCHDREFYKLEQEKSSLLICLATMNCQD